MAITLYHFTKPEHWEQILKDGHLDPSWDYGGTVPAIVHTTDSPDPSTLPQHHEVGRTIRFELLLPEQQAHRWHTWGNRCLPPESFRSLGIPVWTPEDPAYLTQTNQESHRWYVVERRIPSTEWVRVTNAETGAIIWPLPLG
ncbi:hypothetical protein [Streptomyces showdoensis]|uniref:Uncharacterized protein n=1 Tax=Streptomyces showdoensis TaxID=68268 RepID=A0A2P2GEG0_STREW|nr:hypothetical protein [Streptomyces showdoensis]KKZ69881.1 hypothetical protein VO63_31865 [Streptomyces showdoensis]